VVERLVNFSITPTYYSTLLTKAAEVIEALEDFLSEVPSNPSFEPSNPLVGIDFKNCQSMSVSAGAFHGRS
jgi:hypothetical protein